MIRDPVIRDPRLSCSCRKFSELYINSLNDHARRSPTPMGRGGIKNTKRIIIRGRRRRPVYLR